MKSAEKNVERVKALAAEGTLAADDLAKANARLADAQDEETLARTLYSGRSAQDMTTEEAQAMIAAARRRVDRQAELVDSQKKLRGKRILPRSKFAALEAELETRRRVFQLAEERLNQVQQIAAMANDESADAGQADGEALLTPEIRYDGYGHFHLRELRSIERAYKTEFHERMPVTAIGETRLHRRMGLDHRGRVDVGLNPDCPQGVWLRHYLEKRHIPYLAFRCAIRGAATAAHIHIGPESTRLRRVRRVRRHSGAAHRVEALR
ncbi:MAG: hypothetical protein ACRD4O_19710 [Bryobacteraceae bacterium]